MPLSLLLASLLFTFFPCKEEGPEQPKDKDVPYTLESSSEVDKRDFSQTSGCEPTTSSEHEPKLTEGRLKEGKDKAEQSSSMSKPPASRAIHEAVRAATILSLNMSYHQ